MAHAFISHSHAPGDLLERLLRLLNRCESLSYFLDSDPEAGIAIGEDWERTLYRELQRAQLVVALITEAQVDSSWCFAELVLARSLGKPILPVLVDEKSGPHPLLRHVQHVAVSILDEECGQTRFIDMIRKLSVTALGGGFDRDHRRPPFPGLAAYVEADAAVFFGREDEIRETLESIVSPLRIDDPPLLSIVGPSGSGKSSLLRAGILARLRQNETRWHLLRPIVPGERPLTALAESLVLSCSEGLSVEAYEQCLRSDVRTTVRNACEAIISKPGSSSRTSVLAIDQMEELFTVTQAPERVLFLEALREISSVGSPFFVLCAMRSEFLDQALRLAPWMSRRTRMLTALEPLRLPAVIAGPAELNQLEFEPALIERMVADTTGGDALPLLNYTLNRLYEAAGTRGRITHKDYESLGGVVAALQHQADAVYRSLGEQHLATLVEPTLIRLASVDKNGRAVRRRLRMSALTPEERRVIAAFTQERLLTTSGTGDGATVEVAHEALLRNWPPLRRAIERSAHSLASLARVEQLAEHWEASGGHPSYLQTGPALQRALSLIEGREISALVAAYLRASTAYAKPNLGRQTTAFLLDFLLALVAAGFISDTYDEHMSVGNFYLATLVIVFVVRFVGFRFGRSPGMQLMGIVMTDRAGRQVGWTRAVVRSLLAPIPNSDRLCGTVVVSRIAT